MYFRCEIYCKNVKRNTKKGNLKCKQRTTTTKHNRTDPVLAPPTDIKMFQCA